MKNLLMKHAMTILRAKKTHATQKRSKSLTGKEWIILEKKLYTRRIK